MSVFPKFIIEYDDLVGNILIIAKCTYHKQLASDVSLIRGGGWFSFDSETKTFTLSGESHDFGRAKLEDIQDCIMRGQVYSSYAMGRSFKTFNFKYKDQCGETIDLINPNACKDENND
jgi:hypothetical protein